MTAPRIPVHTRSRRPHRTGALVAVAAFGLAATACGGGSADAGQTAAVSADATVAAPTGASTGDASTADATVPEVGAELPSGKGGPTTDKASPDVSTGKTTTTAAKDGKATGKAAGGKECFVGTWKTGAMTFKALTVKSGGDGILMTIKPDLSFTWDPTPMTPVVVTMNGMELSERFDGAVAGKLVALGADKYKAQDLDLGKLTVTASATVAGTKANVFDHVPFATFLGAFTGSEKLPTTDQDWQAYDCTGSTLVLKNPAGEWTLTKA